MIVVNIIGSGHVGYHLCKALVKSDLVSINQWLIRNATTKIDFSFPGDIVRSIQDLKPADITIIAVHDDAISEVSKDIPFSNSLVVHTSGSVNIHDLDRKHHRGVFYPLQSFSKSSDIHFAAVPICVEALEKTDVNLLKALAAALGSTPYKMNTEQRQTLHLSAVYVNNFVNQLYRIAHEISDAKHINFNILKPLILETAKKVQDISPYMAQTGPAIRNDKKTITRHLKLIDNDTHKAIYQLLTQSIKDTHGRR
ncbi:DUF2520 domain-containing protein [Ichthyenterobacterium sp. W332]|uniref:DUF2520 domain-containing protein n=1 Tax=Microcosmobacter mediterraneus TaxID=3075607 RepID=A0ABU2YK68_9FLAO|nr:DUF2520 domain-containing protein [Ichthyenterobacterium sp. W332]MDT0557620.1 DUF2520 domain-containing protein [Ichthyenterobacterium sp. W332]